MNNLINITNQDLIDAEKAINKHPVYSKDIYCARIVVKKYPDHKGGLEEIIAKIAVIDSLNNTQTFRSKKNVSMSELAVKIKNISDIDDRLKKGDKYLVTEIAKIYPGHKLYSFASKYCTIHNQEVYNRDDYSKYDNVVRENLPCFINVSKKDYYQNYDIYMKTIDDLIKINGLSNISKIRRKIDSFIWWKYRKVR